jgi:alpha-galactosidase
MVTPIPSLGFSLKDAGYEYIVMDGGWRQDWLEPDGRLVPDYHGFGGVEGMKELFKYIHKSGLKTGFHNTPGYADCAAQPNGTGDNPQLIMEELAEWGIDFIKWDHCEMGTAAARNQDYDRSLWTRMKYYMDNCGRDVVFYSCVGNESDVFKEWCTEVAHMWLTLRDIASMGNNNQNGGASWNINYGTFATAIYEAGLLTATLADLAGPGSWNDPNFIPVGDAGLNLVENQSTFNLWCMLSAPLMLSGDPRKMIHDAPLMKILTNKELLAIDKDGLKAGKRIKATSPSGVVMNAEAWKNFSEESLDIWARPLSDGSWAVMLVNNTSETRDITVSWNEVIYNSEYRMSPSETYSLRDLNQQKDLGQFTNSYTARAIPPHGSVVLKSYPFITAK